MIEEIDSFIEQFDKIDRGLALIMLSKLHIVTNEDFEEYITSEIITRWSNGPRTALFVVEQEDDEDYSSSDKIGYILENIVRIKKRFLVINPSLESMKAEKISKIVLIDDGINSGLRITKYLKSDKFKTIKSWISYHKCSLEVLSYFAYDVGIEHINANTKIVSNYISKYTINKNNGIYDDEMKQLCIKYGARTNKDRASLGFFGVCGFMFFEHGIPNSLPSMYWANGSNKSWEPLFCNRGISRAVADYFINSSKVLSSINAIADIGKTRLALSILDQIENKRIDKRNVDLLTLLSLFSAGVDKANMQRYVLMDDEYIKNMIKDLLTWNYIDSENKVTELGKYVLEKYKNLHISKKELYNNVVNYLPKHFRGVPIRV